MLMFNCFECDVDQLFVYRMCCLFPCSHTVCPAPARNFFERANAASDKVQLKNDDFLFSDFFSTQFHPPSPLSPLTYITPCFALLPALLAPPPSPWPVAPPWYVLHHPLILSHSHAHSFFSHSFLLPFLPYYSAPSWGDSSGTQYSTSTTNNSLVHQQSSTSGAPAQPTTTTITTTGAAIDASVSRISLSSCIWTPDHFLDPQRVAFWGPGVRGPSSLQQHESVTSSQ